MVSAALCHFVNLAKLQLNSAALGQIHWDAGPDLNAGMADVVHCHQQRALLV
jgi:hypothetical protein